MTVTTSKALVLLSAGLDSSVNLAMAVQEFSSVLAITFDYGQRAARAELRSAQFLCQHYGVEHQILNLPFIGAWGVSSLTDLQKEIPKGEEIQIDNLARSQKSAQSVWVPNRNGIFLNTAAGLAESLDISVVIPGFNLEEAQTFADNSEDFLRALNQSFSFSTRNQVQVQSYTLKMTKIEIAKKAKELALPIHLIWPCYKNQERWCGQCESCQRSMRALSAAGIDFGGLI
jgi:7-cyano-7-deazaguanine synthase